MGIYLEWGVGWYYLILVFGIVWASILYYRKDFDWIAQLKMGVLVTVLAFIIENIAVANNLWNYTPGNWPVILWLNYFMSGIMAYQIAGLVKTHSKR